MKLTLRGRLALSFMALAAVVFALLGLYLNHVFLHYDSESTRQRLIAEAYLVQRLLPPPPWSFGPSLQRTVLDLDHQTGDRLTLIDPDGRVVADSRADPPAMENHTGRPERLRALAAGLGSSVRLSATLHLSLLYVALRAGPPASRWVLRLAVPLTVARQASHELQRVLLAAFLVAALVIFLVSARVTDALTRPLQRLVQVARRVAGGDLTARLSGPAPGEVGVLGEVFNSAVERLAALLETSQREAQRYAALLEQMGDGVVVVDSEGRVQLSNRVFAETFGLDRDWAASRHVQEVTLNYDLSALLVRALDQAATQHGEIALIRPQPRTLYAAVTPLTDEQGRLTGAIALLRDLTELQRADQVRRDFVANASHELRTPAAAIRALAEVLADGALRDAVKGPRFVDQIVSEADRLTRLLDDMLTLTRVERGGELLHAQSVSAAEALAAALARVEPLAAARDVALSREVGESDQVHADPAGLQTALLNLLDNAIKYTPPSGAVTLRGRAVPGGYEISVADTGPGIPAEHLSRIFERFYRVDKARDRATGGTGLGLAIVKHLAEAHGGRVSVHSELGRGSTFTVFFPGPPPV
jgi:two-component system phosphate regulon sensor histidine kinase PhoR